MLATSLSFSLMRAYASFHANLLHDHIEPAQRRAAMIQSAASPALFAVALVLSFVVPPAAIAIQVGILLLFFFRSPSGSHPAPESGG